MVALVVLRNKAIKPLLAAAQDRRPVTRRAKSQTARSDTTKPFAWPCKASFRNSGWLPEHRQLFFQIFQEGPKTSAPACQR